MSSILYDYVACKRYLECLFGLGALDKIKFLEQARMVRAQVPPSVGKLSIKITCGNWYRLYGAALKSDTSSWDMYLVCNGKYTNPQHHWEKNFHKRQRK
ncbi:hypothetical protein TNCV_1774681 [Trichonephila clavipes]|nr:hypothetical protein TNCV_1774681 [Trichonephila clavipes]